MGRYTLTIAGPEGSLEIPWPSVTEIIDSVLAKPGLHDWYYKQGIMGVSLLLEKYKDKLPSDVPSIHSLMKSEGLSPYAQRDAAGAVGQSVHKHAKALAQGRRPKSYPVFTEWWKERGWKASNILAAEQTVVNLANGYAGTLDLVYTQNGEVVLSDIKTGKIQESHTLQLEAYRQAWESVGLEHIDQMSIIQVPRDGSPVTESFVDITEDLTEAWEGVLNVYRWGKSKKRRG